MEEKEREEMQMHGDEEAPHDLVTSSRMCWARLPRTERRGDRTRRPRLRGDRDAGRGRRPRRGDQGRGDRERRSRSTGGGAVAEAGEAEADDDDDGDGDDAVDDDRMTMTKRR